MEPEGYREVMEERHEQSRRKAIRKDPQGMAYTYRLFLSWLIEQPALYEQVKHIVHVEELLRGAVSSGGGAAIRAAVNADKQNRHRSSVGLKM